MIKIYSKVFRKDMDNIKKGADKMNKIRKLSSILSIFVLLVLVILASSAVRGTQDADRVYVNGNIYTVDEAFSTASAFAVKDGRFIYVDMGIV